MKSHGSRKFYHLPDTPPSSECGNEDFPSSGRSTKKFRSKSAHFRGSTRDLMQMIDHNIIGKDTTFQGPFGPRKSVYMDHTASGQPLRCIEGFISDNVLPYYGNTHTTTTLTSSQTTMYRHEAKDVVRNSVGASEHDSVIFCGSGATGAVHKLVQALVGDAQKPRPVVFSGPFEHHSNLLPWRDIGAKMVYIPETANGRFDIDCLEKRLQEAKADEDNKDRLLIGCFSVGSNVTGVVTDDVAVTILMHKYGGLAFWDYAAAAAHVQIVMNPVVSSCESEGLARKDALYFSGHKLVGGPQTPGVLVAKKFIFDNQAIPNGAGGGTVFFVTQDSHRYLKNVEYREEGGTPAILESIRLGLVFRLKDTVGSHNIVSQEAMYTKKALQEWKKFPAIKILGPEGGPRLPIVSFMIQHLESGYYLHYNYVVALLNDLFGIQTRGGCACAGPYAQELLGIDLSLAKTYEDLLLEDSRLDRDHLRRYLEGSPYEIFRPGFTRLSIPFHASMAEAEFVIEAVQLVAQHGWKLLPLYSFNPETGEFHHHANHMFHHRKWLSWASFDSEGIRTKERVRNNSEDCVNYKECLEQAKNILTNAHNMSKRRPLPDQTLLFDTKYSHLRWFLLPSEAQTLAASDGSSKLVNSPKPFIVKQYESIAEEDQISSSNTVDLVAGSLSVPKQLLKSCWSVDHSLKISANKLVEADSLTEISTGSELNVSSNENESENEYSMPGAIVGGPTICFGPSDSGSNISSVPPIPGVCSSNEEPVRDPRLSLDMGENSVVKDSRGDSYELPGSMETVILNYDKVSVTSVDSSGGYSQPSCSGSVCDSISVPVHYENAGVATGGQVYNSNNLLLATAGEQQQQYVNGESTSMYQGNYQSQVSQNSVVAPPQGSPNVQGNCYGINSMAYNNNCNQVQNSYAQNYGSPPQPATYYNQSVAVNGCQQIQNSTSVYYNGQQMNGCSSVENYDTSWNGQVNNAGLTNYTGLAVNTVDQMNGVGMVFQHSPQVTYASPNSSVCTQDSVFYPQTPNNNCTMSEMTVNVGTAFEYPSNGAWTNNNVYGTSPLPVSPLPPQSSYTPVPQEYYNGSYPSTPMSPQVPFPGSNTAGVVAYASPVQSQSSVNSVRSESMKDTMRRVTNELANELKSEIREVISQVEQGMDPVAVRERASSFSAKDKVLEGLQSRARTLSGQLLNGNLKKNLSLEGHSLSLDESTSSRGSSYPSSSSSSLPRETSVDAQLGRENSSSTNIELLDGRKNSSDATDDVSNGGETVEIQNENVINEADNKAELKKEADFNQAFLRLNMNPVEVETEEVKPTNSKAKWHCPPKTILKQTLKALNEFSMLKDGDRVLLCLSGGKDSLSMLHIMKQVQYNLKKSGISFTLGAVTVDPGSTSYNPRPLIPYLKALGVPYYYEEQGIMRDAMEKGPEEVASICSFCSRMKRGRIYACARKYGYNVVALGQHLDDLAESFLMSVFHNGLLRTMKAAYSVKEGDLRVIRPLVNVREKALRDFAESSGLPVIPENCPACFDAPKERHRIKQMLAQQEILFPKIYVSLRAAMQPLLAISKTGVETKSTVAKNLVDVNGASDDE